MLKKAGTKELKKFKFIFALCLIVMFSFALGGTLYAVNYSNNTEVGTTLETLEVYAIQLYPTPNAEYSSIIRWQ